MVDYSPAIHRLRERRNHEHDGERTVLAWRRKSFNHRLAAAYRPER
jgi:hypothetical protein